ncbi:MAG: pseudaminic acid synthase [Planctomycetota bacterium]
MKIGEFEIGTGHTYIIAELSANHGGSFDRAADIVRAACVAGADAVKLQTYTAETLTFKSNEAPFRIEHGTIWDGRNLYELYKQAAMPWEWQPELKSIANDLGMDLFSSPFDPTAVDFLEQMDVPAYKIASFEIVDVGLLRRVARTGKPVVLSTGMATAEDIELAMETLRANGTEEIALLKCTSAYPAPLESMNLQTIPEMRDRFGVAVGLSDHSHGHLAATTAVALGASVIEKHLTLSRSDGGPDSAFSLEPDEFAQMVTAVREAEAVLGTVQFGPTDEDAGNRRFRRSLFAIRDIVAGEPFTLDNVRSIRPGNGLAPRYLDQLMTRTARSDISAGTPLSWRHIQ